MAHLVLYDGVCGLCNRLVRFLLPRDRHDRLRFAALQGELARRALAPHGKDPVDLDTVYVIADWRGPKERLLERGRAISFALGALGGPWRLTAMLRIVPSFLVNAAYRFVAGRRYRWFGRYEACPAPEPRYRDKFLG
jgi:predicted DCC family thiol-disulfide oxidoreductase YuxK